MQNKTRRRLSRRLQEFLHHEASAGLIVMAAAALALLVNNSPVARIYEAVLAAPFQVRIGSLDLDKTVLLFINDGLMAVFFLLVGLEIKREVLRGELSTRAQAILPVIAAIGGVVVPSLIYAVINSSDPVALRGWAIPAATDIAFALAVLALVGPGVPASLKVFLLALAIIDDLAAIIIIAIFYTANLSLMALSLSAAGIAVLITLNRRGVRALAPYILTGVFIWVCVLKSGVHATLAGVAVGLTIPLLGKSSDSDSPLERLEHMLHPWVAYAILPVFAFANAGVSLAGVSFDTLVQPIPLGIALGLLIGKPVGIVLASWLTVKSGISRLPEGAHWGHMVAIGLIAGIGFTMSLFIGSLAFSDPAFAAPVRIGVLLGSITAATLGYLLLRRMEPRT